MTVPTLVYGTAWKEDQTEPLVKEAFAAGFRAFDTANQRKHYHEAGVGAGLQGAAREALWLQTKFTYMRGQDHRLPYDPSASLERQVRQSFASSLEHLHTDYLDSYLLHGPWSRHGLASQDTEVWRTMEALHASGKVVDLGVSNVDANQLEALWTFARVKPSFVQNRCYASLGWDRAVREVCARHSIRYQGFSLLTANRDVLRSAPVNALATKYERAPTQIVLRLARDLGMMVLTGTTQRAHMDLDLAIDGFALTEAEVAQLEGIAG